MSENEKAQYENAITAMEQFQAQITVPILFDTGSDAELFASGVLFAHGGRHFILTAAHLFDPPFRPEHLVLIATPDTRKLAKPTALGNFEIALADRAPFDFDSAVIELFDEGKIHRISAEWNFLTLDQVGLPSAEPVFALGGYPEALVKKHVSANHGPMFVVRTTELGHVPEAAERPVDPAYDVFFEYSKEAEKRGDSDLSPTPELPGTSGGSIVQYLDQKQPLWSPSTATRMVALQSGGSTDRRWFRGKNWRAILKAFEKHDPTLAGELRQRLAIPR